MITYPYQVPALVVDQPLGVFFVTVLPAELLLEVAYSDALSATYSETAQSYELHGTQRLPQPKRLDPIAEFINRTDAAFPNAIILAANFRKEDGLSEDEPNSDTDTAGDEGIDNVGNEHEAITNSAVDRRWRVDPNAAGGYTLTIPTKAKLAAIIDGQHRLFAFTRALARRRDMSLLCSVFLDLPKPYQAQLFATINSTQKPVDKSLTFELFGYNIAEEGSEYWSPDKLAVFLARRLATDPKSPLQGRILIAPKRDQTLEALNKGADWCVSTAVVVEGIMRLFTTNPKKDTNQLLHDGTHPRLSLAHARKDRSPMREYYLSENDALIYEVVKNYLEACQITFWASAPKGSFIVKTVGVQALFDVLRLSIKTLIDEKDIQTKRFIELLRPASAIDFAGADFRNASGSGRSIIKNAILRAITGN
ncbi:DGQHR domain-containing protein [Lysobacter enzymogenes]|uniref:DGQHR domain-containing protein n=1 Tax=Lysobacter enzymogenes TaxID=69 RepID=UPI00374A6FAE